ncbi:MAG: response regulator transcription factor [Chloroflexi bacterium]|nr:response regulator transcription factor [Chloroflexota bacterium]
MQQRITVFLVDDHAVVRDGLRLLLETQRDMEVVGGAADGQEAIDQIAIHCPDIVLMDVAMPVMDGIEATRQVGPRCPSTQVIILSMHSTAEHVYRALRAGARGYLLKESAGSEVVKAMRQVYDGGLYLSPKIASAVSNPQILHRERLQDIAGIEQYVSGNGHAQAEHGDR